MKYIPLFLCALFFAPALHAEEILVAVASNFTAPMREIAQVFTRQTGHEVKLSFGSSGRHSAQISNGAPFQVFFSADQDKPLVLEQAGKVVEGSRFTYALGTLALWSATAGLDLEEGRVLQKDTYTRLAIANPALAPYGVAAMEVLAALDTEDSTRTRRVQGENIAQTFQFVSTGNAELGFVALSQIIDPLTQSVLQGSVWIVPANMHQPIRQDAVLLQRGADSIAARMLLDFVRGPQGREIITSYGYGTEH